MAATSAGESWLPVLCPHGSITHIMTAAGLRSLCLTQLARARTTTGPSMPTSRPSCQTTRARK
eukprot:scaffold651144_cov56-Prasinocladus_malaysianus.AAC.1